MDTPTSCERTGSGVVCSTGIMIESEWIIVAIENELFQNDFQVLPLASALRPAYPVF